MNAEEAGMYFGARLDNSQLKNDAQEASSILSEIGSEANKQSVSIRELMTNFPNIDLNIVTNAKETQEEFDAAFREIDRVVDENKNAIVELEKEYARLGKEAGSAFMKGDDKTAKELQQQQRAIKEVVKARKEVVKAAEETADELSAEEARFNENRKAVESNEKAHISFRQRLREVKLALVEMEAAGERGTAKYRELQEEAGRLTDAWSDAQAQATILANDQRGFQGIISGLQGIAGAASVATGVIGLFGGENEKLQQIMLKVQSLMAITMGLQQVSNTLNKDSAFSLVTLNGLKEIWNKLLGDSSDALEEENNAIAENTASQEVNTAATNADTAAEIANKTATAAGTAATNAATGAEVANTTATKAHTTATVAQTVATKAASVALKGLKAALISTGIGALIVLVGELVGWLVELFETTSKAEEEQKELNEIMAKGNEAYAKASVEISDYKDKIERFNGTKEQEEKLVKELNQKYGEAMGYYKSLSEWQEVLKKKGDAYCETLLKEAQAQALLTKYTEAYIKLEEVREKARRGEYDHWYNTKAGDEMSRQKAIKEAEDEMNKWLEQYKGMMNEAQNIRDQYDLNPHIDTTTVKPKGGNGKTFDPQKAALDTKKAIDEYRKAVSKYVKDANDELNELLISGQEQGLERELKEIHQATRRKVEAWNEQLVKLAELRKATAKAQYMNTNGATEVGWSNTEDGKKTINDWIKVIQSETPKVIEEFERVWEQITENGEKQIIEAQQRYTDALIEEFGTQAQKEEKLIREWTKKIVMLPAEYIPEATRQMEQALSSLNSEKFKADIDWEGVFGNLSEQAIPVLESTLSKVKKYFEDNKASMSTQDIKDYQEAIAKMEEEISSRNPFSAMIKSINDIKTSKAEMLNALADIKKAQEELTAAIMEQEEAERALDEISRRGEETGNYDYEALNRESTRLVEAKKRVANATEQANDAENRYNKALNKNTAAHKQFANNLRSVGDVIGNVGRNAEKLAAIFNSDVAKSIGKAVTLMDETIDATSTIIDAIGDLGKGVAQGVEQTVQATADGAKAAATSAATSIATIEKASAVLAIISAAIQLASAVASLFNDDDEKQEQIERLQRRIDQLQWELNNRDTVRLIENTGSAVDRVKRSYAQATEEVLKLHYTQQQLGNFWIRISARVVHQNEIIQKSIEKIATAYANMKYTADKALGGAKYDDARAQLENIAQQQILIQQQINAEKDKKKTDWGAIEEWERKIEELGQQAIEIINNMVEDIIGDTSSGIANQLADAFFEAFEAGENAAEAWGKKVDDIVADILKRMMISKFLEEPLGDIFNKYKSKWFKDGNFVGIDAIVQSMTDFRNDLNNTYGVFADVMKAIPEDLRDLFMGAADVEQERTGVEKGIAQASQDSVDELNGRATAIQGHTYSIANDTRLLLGVANAILESVLNIETSTDGITGKVDRLQSDIKAMRDDISEIVTKGIIIKR